MHPDDILLNEYVDDALGPEERSDVQRHLDDCASCRATVADLVEASAWIRAGGVVAYPTDTFYGLAVDPTSDTAVAALFDL